MQEIFLCFPLYVHETGKIKYIPILKNTCEFLVAVYSNYSEIYISIQNSSLDGVGVFSDFFLNFVT